MVDRLVEHFKACVRSPEASGFNSAVVPRAIPRETMLRLFGLAREVLESRLSDLGQRRLSLLAVATVARKSNSAVANRALVESELWKVVTAQFRAFRASPADVPEFLPPAYGDLLRGFFQDLRELFPRENCGESKFSKFYSSVMNPAPFGPFVYLVQNFSALVGSERSFDLLIFAIKRTLAHPSTPPELRKSLISFLKNSRNLEKSKGKEAFSLQNSEELKRMFFCFCEENFLYRHCTSKVYSNFKDSIAWLPPGGEKSPCAEKSKAMGPKAGRSGLGSLSPDLNFCNNQIPERHLKSKVSIFDTFRSAPGFDLTARGSPSKNQRTKQLPAKRGEAPSSRFLPFVVNRERYTALKALAPSAQDSLVEACFSDSLLIYQDAVLQVKVEIMFGKESENLFFVACSWKANDPLVEKVRLSLSSQSRPRKQSSCLNTLNWVFEGKDFRDPPAVSVSYRRGSLLTMRSVLVALPANKLVRISPISREKFLSSSSEAKLSISVDNIVVDSCLFFSIEELSRLLPGLARLDEDSSAGVLALPEIRERVFFWAKIEELTRLSLGVAFDRQDSARTLNDFLNEILFVVMNLNLGVL